MVPPSWRHPRGASPDGRATPAGRSVPNVPCGQRDGRRGTFGAPRDVLPCAHRGGADTVVVMSALTTERLASGRGTAGEVIAGLANDGSALTVARAAVEEAMSRHCGVR